MPNSRIKELREKRAKTIVDMRELLTRADNAGDPKLKAQDQVQYDKWFTEQERLQNQIATEEKQQELERELLTNSVNDGQITLPNTPTQPDNAEARSMKAFNIALGQGIQAVPADLVNALQFDSDTAGGFLSAPQEFVAQLIKAVDNSVFMRMKATVLPPLTGAHSLGAPALDNDPADDDWVSEIQSTSEDSTMSFGKRELVPHLMTKLIKVSMKLLNNSATPAGQIVNDRLAYKVGITAEKGYLTGSGANQPLGVFTASDSGISTSRDVSTGNTTTSIKFDGLIEAKYSLKGQYQNTAEWLFHRDAVKQISKLKDGEGQYIWSASVRDNDPDRLLGRPVNQSEYAPNTFTTGLYAGLLGDFSHYWIVDSLQMEIQRLNELYAATNQVGFISRFSSDGAPVLEEAFARVKLA